MNLPSILASTGHRTTLPRQTVFAALKATNTPMSMAAVTAACPSVNRSSVYRTLELFERIGIVVVITIGWKQRYELAEPFRPHHHHIHCKSCNKTIAIHPPELERLVGQIAKQYDFIISEHHFELLGICDTCRKTNETSAEPYVVNLRPEEQSVSSD